MSRFTSKGTIIAYAGQNILDIGHRWADDGSTFELEHTYTTQAINIIDSEHPEIASFGNIGGSHVVAVAVDYADIDTAHADSARRVAHADAHQTGELTSTTYGKATLSVHAGLTRISVSRLFPSAGGVRMIYTYEFILGADIV